MTDPNNEPVTCLADIEELIGPTGSRVSLTLIGPREYAMHIVGSAMGDDEDRFLRDSATRMMARVESKTPPNCGLCNKPVAGGPSLGCIAVVWADMDDKRSGFSSPICEACEAGHEDQDSLEAAILKTLDEQLGVRLVPRSQIHDPGHA